MKVTVLVLSVMFALFIHSMIPNFCDAQQKVVVIPLMEEPPPRVPTDPVPAPSPPNDAYKTDAYTVYDRTTGLLWQRSDSGQVGSYYDAWNNCQSLELPPGSGASRWRLPTIQELMTIVDYGASFQSINNAFSDTNSAAYWTASPLANRITHAWDVDFGPGYLGHRDAGTQDAIWRCVTGPAVNYGKFHGNNDGTVTDRATGLMWAQQPAGSSETWAGANTYCENSELGGHRDWRLPSVKELHSLLDTNISDPAIDLLFFPQYIDGWFWSATSHITQTDHAWGVDFEIGIVGYIDKSNATTAVRCVRTDQ